MGIEQGQEAEGSPPSNPPPHDAGGGAPPAKPAGDTPPAPDSSPGAGGSQNGGSPPPTGQDPPPKGGDDPAPANDLEAALDLLSKPEDRKKPKEDGQPPPHRDGKPDDQKQKPGPEAASPDDPYTGMSEDEKFLIQRKAKTKERFEAMYRRARAAEEAAEALKVAGAPARDIVEVLKAAKIEGELGYVDPRQVPGLVAGQAAINRIRLAKQAGRQADARDVQAAQAFVSSVGKVANEVGVQATSQQQPEFTGEIPKDIKDLHEVYGVLSEDEAKAIAALRARKSKDTSPPPKDQAPPPSPDPESPPPEVIAAQAQEQAWIEATLERLHQDGVKPPETQTYYETKLVPRMHAFLAEKVPGLPPSAVLDRLDPKAKHQLVLLAHQAEREASSPPPSSAGKPPQGNQPRRGGRPLTGSGTVPHAPVPRQGADPVASAIDYLARG